MSVSESTKILDEQVKAISSMTRSELMAWINERLQRRDLILEDDEEDSSSYPIIALVPGIFRYLSRKQFTTRWLISCEFGRRIRR